MQEKAKVEEIASGKSNGSPGQRLAWLNALETFPSLEGPNMDLLLKAIHSPEVARMLGLFLSRDEHSEPALAAFMEQVDESEESLEEWLKAFEVFACFIESTAHRPSLSQARGYLHCCATVAHTGSSYATFPMAVETMLETYGYKGEED
ncbi:MAG: hypothetical protein AB3N64_08255 [Puniceicoccaceae bacterium]